MPVSARARRPLALLTAALLACAAPAARAQFSGPEPDSARVEKPLATAQRHMVVAANPLASEAGLEMLRRGGSAVDAAIAAQLALGVVEPQSSGLGGGAFLVLATPGGAVTTFDGRETAAAGVTPAHFIGADGKPLGYIAALAQGRAVGVPGLPAMLALAHGKHGKLPWAALFEPAIRLAEQGFPAQPRMVRVLTEWEKVLGQSADMRRAYYRDGQGIPQVGERVAFPEQAESLRLFARLGPDALYRGPLGAALVERLAQAAGAEGPPVVKPADLEAYRAVEREAVCRPYRAWRVCGMGPPSAGGIGVLQILGMLEGHDLATLGKDSPQAWHLIIEAQKRAYADREVHIADPDQVAVPVRGLLDGGYIAQRAASIDPAAPTPTPVPAGEPPFREGRDWGAGPEPDVPSTSHLSVIDGEGTLVSLTSSVEFAFGSGILAGGLVLNNQLTDFSFAPVKDGKPVANAPGGGKRPRSSMSPMVVFDGQGRPVIAVGSPGGSAIIGYTAQALIAMLDWGLDAREAATLPSLLNRNGPATTVEAVPEADALAAALAGMGHTVKRDAVISGLHIIRVVGTTIQGGADPRRDGAAAGE